ncbi:hypothetical protein D3C81_1335640 [compost metagenome]
MMDALDLFYLTGQRVADTLKMDERDIKDGKLSVQQGKTGVKRRIEMLSKRFDDAREAAGISKAECTPTK